MPVIEIGPGLGLAGEAFLRHRPQTAYHMIEAHQWFAEFISKQLGSTVHLHHDRSDQAIDRVLQSIGDAPTLVYMDNVLEHVPEPRAFIADLRRRLAPGSVLLIDVPNEFGLLQRHRLYTAMGAATTISPHHINLFTTRAFSTMLRALSLRHEIHQRGIRARDEVNCLPDGAVTDVLLSILRIVPLDTMIGMANNLRVAVHF